MPDLASKSTKTTPHIEKQMPTEGVIILSINNLKSELAFWQWNFRIRSPLQNHIKGKPVSCLHILYRGYTGLRLNNACIIPCVYDNGVADLIM